MSRSKEMLTGIALTLTGALCTLVAYVYYPFGSWSYVGPGGLPFFGGISLAAAGVLIAWRVPTTPTANARFGLATLMPLAVIGTFIVCIDRVGLIATVFICTLIATAPWAKQMRYRAMPLGISLVVAIGCSLFTRVLGLPIPL